MTEPTPSPYGPPDGLFRAGSIAYYAGLMGFAAGVGSAAGFYAADQGLRWLPEMLSSILVLCAVSLVGVVGGRWARGKAFKPTERGLRVGRRMVAGLTVAVALLGARVVVYWAEQPSALTSLGEAGYEEAWATDVQRLFEIDHGLERLLGEAETLSALDDGEERVLTPDEERALRGLWLQFYDYAFALDQLRVFHEDWYRFDPSRTERRFHLRSFLLHHTAELVLYEKTARLARRVRNNPHAVRFLDSPHPEAELPAGTWAQVLHQLTSTEAQARLLAGQRYLSVLSVGVNARNEARALGAERVWREAEDHLRMLERVSLITRAAGGVGSQLITLRQVVRHAWYPAQSGVAEWFGDTRVKRLGWYLITPEQVAALRPALRPGDVLLSRKNWYLSNVGLPGFWPHALLYLGDPGELEAWSDDDAVKAWVSAQGGGDHSFSEWMAERYPEAWLRYLVGDEAHPYVVIEAVSEGVVLSTLEHAAGDSLAALSPNVDKVMRARAIDRAFSQYGRPYDFDFDFATDHAVVCTELVWRAYRPEGDEGGLDLPLVEVAGRQTLPANELVKLYDSARGRPDAAFTFVAFLDAREKDLVAVERDEAAFAGSWKRKKWDLAPQ